jgi:hypothetical protein
MIFLIYAALHGATSAWQVRRRLRQRCWPASRAGNERLYAGMKPDDGRTKAARQGTQPT